MAVVKWTGYPEDEATLEKISTIQHTNAWKIFRRKWIQLNNQGIFPIEQILERKVIDNQPHVHVQWSGLSIQNSEWIPEENLI
jgi:hypothetical protein